ncbi:MAG TPA: hypothetical protein VFH10_18085 [Nocardioides sp.]|uniref:hypothetical protein n=1 Tax=Nocardioides sp. TaxID=35761 RepID=UPI002D7F04A8|nr:hypothetical protein [Nocardioides sp.]HET6654553.1 hypothetical protein [Nocardioides sp.]
MRRDAPAGGGIFELTVQGSLGPVLRCAVRPGRSVEEPHTCTTIRAVAPDVVDLVRVLDSHGLSIESVSRLPAAQDGSVDGTVG